MHLYIKHCLLGRPEDPVVVSGDNNKVVEIFLTPDGFGAKKRKTQSRYVDDDMRIYRCKRHHNIDDQGRAKLKH